MKIRKLSRFMTYENISFGDYILFQEYEPSTHDGKQFSYKVSKPILAIYLGYFLADQTLGFNYVKWVNEKSTERITNDYVKDYRVNKQVDSIHSHIEWDDFIDILGHWKNKPNWKQILKSYRYQNIKETVLSDEFSCD